MVIVECIEALSHRLCKGQPGLSPRWTTMKRLCEASTRVGRRRTLPSRPCPDPDRRSRSSPVVPATSRATHLCHGHRCRRSRRSEVVTKCRPSRAQPPEARADRRARRRAAGNNWSQCSIGKAIPHRPPSGSPTSGRILEPGATGHCGPCVLTSSGRRMRHRDRSGRSAGSRPRDLGRCRRSRASAGARR